MAGHHRLTGELRQQDLDLLEQCGLRVQVLVDCSHNQHVKTKRADRPQDPIIAKPIELDVTLGASHDPDKVRAAMQQKLTTAPSMSPAFQVYKLYQKLMNQAAGASDLRLRGIKLEFPHFDRSILNPAGLHPSTCIASAIRACTAQTVAAFNALPEDVRCAMGMYLRKGANRFVLSGIREAKPREAVP